MEVTTVLKKARIKKGVTQAEVGNVIGITAGAYSKIETGVNFLDAQHILPICHFLEIPIVDLVQACGGKEISMDFELENRKEDLCENVSEMISTFRVDDTSVLEEKFLHEEKNAIILSKNTRLPVLSDVKRNVLVVGSAATGKSYGYVFSNLLQCNGSYVVVDAWGSMRKLTEDMFRKQGYQIKVLDICNTDLKNICMEDISDIGHLPTVVYVVPSYESNVNETVFPHFIAKIYNEAAPDANIPIHLLLDEFPNLGKMPDLWRQIFVHQYEVSCSIIVQSLEQLEMLYGEDWETLARNCDAILYLGGCCYRTNEFISKLSGKQELRCIPGTKKMPRSKVMRDVISVEELMRMDRRDCWVIIRGQKPVLDQKYDPQNHPNYIP